MVPGPRGRALRSTVTVVRSRCIHTPVKRRGRGQSCVGVPSEYAATIKCLWAACKVAGAPALVGLRTKARKPIHSQTWDKLSSTAQQHDKKKKLSSCQASRQDILPLLLLNLHCGCNVNS